MEKVIFNNVSYQRLSFLSKYADDEIPTNSGVYYWAYWPYFDPSSISHPKLIEKLLDFGTRQLYYSEPFKGQYKFKGEIAEQWFKDNGNLFGLNDSKHEDLSMYLKNSGNVKDFFEVFKVLCFGRPFYIGKANDLRSRLNQHFNRRSEILDMIDSKRIPHSEIWIGIQEIDVTISPKINNIVEEIFSRVFKPGLTKKPN